MKSLTITTWNIQGPKSGNQPTTENIEFLSQINDQDIIILLETWLLQTQTHTKSGGIIIWYRENLATRVKHCQTRNKPYLAGTRRPPSLVKNDLFICAACTPWQGWPYFIKRSAASRSRETSFCVGTWMPVQSLTAQTLQKTNIYWTTCQPPS